MKQVIDREIVTEVSSEIAFSPSRFSISRLWRDWGKKLLAIALIISLFWFARLPELSATERKAIASRFSFTSFPLPELPGGELKFERSVHPSLQRHSGWISSVGAAVALNDLDGDGLPNDVCHVDPRSDRVTVAPVPGEETRGGGDRARYQPFLLEPTADLYNPAIMAPMGCLPGDLNEDGLMDLLVYYWGRTPIAFLRTVGNGEAQPKYIQQAIASEDREWYTNAATFADLDGDGHNDLLLGNFFQDNAQILDAHATSDKSQVMQHAMSRADNGGGHHLFQWVGATAGDNPTVRYREVEGVFQQSKSKPWALAIATADLDGDLLPEIYLANDFGSDRLLHNRSQPGRFQFEPLIGEKKLNTPNSKVLGRDSFKGMGVDFGDVNDDGLLDIFVSNIADDYALEESHFLFVSTGELGKIKDGIAPYEDSSESLGVSRYGWGWDTKFGDFDNDGVSEALLATGFLKGKTERWAELHETAMGNDELLSHSSSWTRLQAEAGDDLSGHQHNPFFVRAKDGRFYDLAVDIGLDRTEVTRGIATADVDGDGDLDFAVANQWDKSYFYRNESPKSGNFLGLKLLLPPGRPAIGASAMVHLPDGRNLVAQVDGGNGHSGARSSDLHFGLGDLADNTPLTVDLRWRDVGGEVRQQSLSLSPGWHELLLGDVAKKRI